MPAGGAFSDKGSAIFTEDGSSELFLLGYLNSALATYFMKRIVNTTATAHVGYIEKLPYRRPSPEIESAVTAMVDEIVAKLKADPDSDISGLRSEIDGLVFDLFEIADTSRDEVLRFYESVGKAGEEPEAETGGSAEPDQAAIE